MSETSEPVMPGSAEAAPSSAVPDPLAGDWSQGLPGPVRAHGVPQPALLALNGSTPMAPPAETAPPADIAPPAAVSFAETAPTPWSDPVVSPAVPDAQWEAAVPAPPSADGETPPDAARPADGAFPPDVASPADVASSVDVAMSVDVASPSEAPAPPEVEPPPVVAQADTPWSAPAPSEPAEEWQVEAAATDFEEVQTPQLAELPSAAADWSSLQSGPDWAASSPAGEPETPHGDLWGAPPPAPAESEWSAAAPGPAVAEWAPTEVASPADWSAAATPDWPATLDSTPPAPAAPAPAWNAPAMGASALEQLDSEPAEPEPGAAAELFGTVPTGGMLAGDDDEMPEEELFPVTIDHEDPDLPEAVDEKAAPKPHSKPLAAFRPPAQTALEVRGEHRVAVHTRGGRTLRGSVRDVDLSKSQFALTPQGGTGPETIYHSDVKAIFFMLAPGEKPKGGDGGKVRVTFADGRVIEGARDGGDAKHGFFLVPLDAARTNTRRIYIAREATSDIKEG